MLPFSRDQFFDVFAAYNVDCWPAAIAAYPLALLALGFAWRGNSYAARWVSAILSLMWAWVGVVYHGIYFSQINPVAGLFAGAFAVQAALFAIHTMTGQGLEYTTRNSVRLIAGAVLVTYAMVAYPLIGLLAGDRYPAIPLFGVAPCPLLIFTFGLLLLARTTRWWLWIVPLLWSIIGGSAVILLSVPQDWALPASALAALVIPFRDRQDRPTREQA